MGKNKNKEKIDREENRYGLFMNENSFNLEVKLGRHYLSNDVVFKFDLYRINIIESKAHKLYGQAKSKDKKFFPPIELNGMIDVGDNEQSYYGENEGGISREDTGEIQIGIYLEELKEKNTEINRGDIIVWNQSGERNRYYEVVNAQNVVDSTKNTIAGMRPYYKTINATPIKEDVTPYLKQDKLARDVKKHN